MNEFEPVKKKHFLKNNGKKYIYVASLVLVLLLGTSYSFTFFISNKKVGEVTLNVGGLTYTISNTSINATGLTPKNDIEGLNDFSKSISIENTSPIEGKVVLSLNRSSGLDSEDLRYGLFVDDVLVEVDDVPEDNELYSDTLASEDTLDLELRLWVKEDYEGEETSFVGEIEPEVKIKKVSIARQVNNSIDTNNNYVKFNCLESNCEIWRMVNTDNNRLVLTREDDLEGATERSDSGFFDPSISYNDSTNLVASQSTDKKNVYLKKGVEITDGDGTSGNPYNLYYDASENNEWPILATLTYNNNGETSTQPLYYGKDNYISKSVDDETFVGWSDGTNTYQIGDIIAVNNNITINAMYNANKTVRIHVRNVPTCGVEFAQYVNLSSLTPNSIRSFNVYSDSEHTDLIMTLSNQSEYEIELPVGEYFFSQVDEAGYQRVDDFSRMVLASGENEWYIFAGDIGSQLPSTGGYFSVNSSINSIEFNDSYNVDSGTLKVWKFGDADPSIASGISILSPYNAIHSPSFEDCISFQDYQKSCCFSNYYNPKVKETIIGNNILQMTSINLTNGKILFTPQSYETYFMTYSAIKGTEQINYDFIATPMRVNGNLIYGLL